MTQLRKTWVYSPHPPKVPADVKAEVQQKAERLVEKVLKPQHIKPPPKSKRFNYLVDIHTKWYRHYFYFCARYRSPGHHALSPFFETRFARMEYIGQYLFHLSTMRHTGQWIRIYPNLSLDECLSSIRDEPLFYP